MKKTLLFTIIALILASCSPMAFLGGSSQSAVIPNTTPASQSGAPASSNGIPNFDHIILIMLENRDYSSVIGPTTQMPLLNTLAQQNVLLSNYFAVTHPSLPNYIALCQRQHPGHHLRLHHLLRHNQPNLADLIEASGRTWKAY